MQSHRKVNWNHIPFAPAKCPLFYGWVVLGLGALGLLMTAPGQTLGISPFIDHLIADLDLSRLQLSLAYMLGTIASSLLLTHAGKLYDRLGARVVGTAACVAFGGVVLGMSRVDRVAAAVGGWLTGSEGTRAALCAMVVGYFLLRFLGQGVLTIVSGNMVLKWFDRRRGLAMGVYGMLTSVGFAYSPRLLDALIDRYTWRGAWVILGLVIGGGFTIVVLLLFRDNPQDCGLRPDGDAKSGQRGCHPTAAKQFSLVEAQRTYALWIFCLTFLVYGLYFTAIAFHIASIFKVAGMTRKQGFAVFLPASVISVAIRLVAGWASDRIRLKHLLLLLLLSMAVSMVGTIALSPGVAVVVLIIGNGLSIGLVGLLMSVTWPRYYGTTHLGAISGFSMAMTVFGSAAGPWLFSLSRAHTGSYDTAAAICLAVTAVLFVCALLADNPQPSPEGMR